MRMMSGTTQMMVGKKNCAYLKPADGDTEEVIIANLDKIKQVGPAPFMIWNP